MPLGQFQQICRHLRDIGLIYPSSEILLYDWGEPFLNPDFLKIVAFLAKEGQTFSLSTNASVVKLAEGKELYKTCKTVIFSMPGFSQASYDRIHGFSFAKIKENIRTLIKNMREQGFVGEGVLSYHVYQFNQGEVCQAEAFARSLGLTFAPIYAYFASYGLTRQYLKGILPQALRSEAEKALYLSHVADLIGERPDGFRCQVADMLSLTAEGQVKLCCCSDDTAEHYLWGSVFALGSMDDWKQLRKEMLNCESCRECRTLGVDYWFFNNPPYVCEEQ